MHISIPQINAIIRFCLVSSIKYITFISFDLIKFPAFKSLWLLIFFQKHLSSDYFYKMEITEEEKNDRKLQDC